MKDIKTSIKRMYTRFALLTAVVVFGAIAIAQAQKDRGDAETAPLSLVDGTLDTAAPIPIATTDGSSVAHEDSAFDIQPTAAEEDVSDDLPSSHWADAPTYDQLDPLPEDEGTSIYSNDDFGPTDYTDSDAPSSFDSDAPPPALPDDIPANDSASLPRRNPFRNPAAAQDAGTDLAIPEIPEHELDVVSSSAHTSGDLEEAPPLLPNDDLPPLDRNSTYDTPADDGSDWGNDPIPPSTPQAPTSRFASEPNDTSYDPSTADTQSIPTHDFNSADAAASEFGSDAPASGRYSASDHTSDPAPLDAGPAPPVDSFDASSSAAADAYGSPEPQRFSESNSFGQGSDEPVELASRTSPTGTGRPGPQSLEGLQTPTLTIHKVAPQEIQVGSTAKFEIRLRNVGSVAANNVVIRDEVPAGTKLVDTVPKATPGNDGAIYWELGTVAPGQDISVTMELIPTTEGQVGSVATVSFESSASAKARSTKPELVLEHTGPTKVLLGEPVRFSIKLSNPGSGAANNVVLEEDVPTGLSHPSGAKLEYEVGTIAPGQSRHLELTLNAAQAGNVLNRLTARADAGLSVEDTSELEVVAPKLQVGIDGPTKRYLDRQATFTVSVANPGTAPARDVELVAQLPQGLKFVSTNNSGYYDQNRNAIVWSLEQLPAGEMGRAQFTAMPTEMGSQLIRAEGHAASGLQANQEHGLQVEGIAALKYVLIDKVDPVEVGGQTTYEIQVTNQGSKAALNVRFDALVPEGMAPVSAKGPTAEQIQGQQVAFAPLTQLAPQGNAVFQITVTGQAAGDHRFRVRMTSDEISTPVIKEESTRVYAD